MSNPRHLLLRLATLMLALAAIFAPQNASAKSHANSETRVRDFSAALSTFTQAKPDLTPDSHYEKLAPLRQLAPGPPLVPKGGASKAASADLELMGAKDPFLKQYLKNGKKDAGFYDVVGHGNAMKIDSQGANAIARH